MPQLYEKPSLYWSIIPTAYALTELSINYGTFISDIPLCSSFQAEEQTFELPSDGLSILLAILKVVNIE